MRIGVIGPTRPDDFADNICDALGAMGIDYVALGPTQPRPTSRAVATGLGMARRSVAVDEALQKRLVSRAREADCTAIITVDANTSPSVIAALQHMGMPSALWFPDHMVNLGRLRMVLAPYRAMFFKEPVLVDRLNAVLGLPVHYLPEACNPRWHTSDQPHGVDPVVVLAGNMYPTRLRLLERLLAADVPVVLYGGGFPRWVGDHPAVKVHTGRSVVRQEKADIYRRAAAVLNNLHPGEVDGVNCRLFEAAGSGAVVLCERRATLADLFGDDEVLAWRTFDELIDLVREVVARPARYEQTGDRAAIRAHGDHSYENRLATVLEFLA